jgi:tetratricopeptide (TPR) repeat protein
MEADVHTNCLLYDRAHNRIHTGTWSSALLFHSLVDEALEEDGVPDTRAKPAPLLAWLDDRQEAPDLLFAGAASHHLHGQSQETLAMLRRCVEREPTSHLYWCRLSQTLGSLSQWEDALEAADKAVAFHASAPRQHLSAGYLLKWKAQCLFMLQRYSDAADLYRLTIEIEDSTHHADCYAQIARCYERMHAYKEAVVEREFQVRDRADSRAEALKARALDEVDEEIVDDERFFLGDAWLELGRSHVRAGNTDAAEWAFRQAVEASPECIKAHAELGALWRCLDRVTDAGDELQEAFALARRKIEQTPEAASALSEMAFVYRAMGKDVEAIQLERRAAETGWTTSEEERTVVSLEARRA